MATYVNDLRLKEIGTGESSGTWGTETNVNLELIGEALGYGTEGITTNANTHTTTVADGSTDPGRAMYIEYTGTLDSACTITIAPNTLSRMHFIENGTSGSQNIIIKQGSGATITIPPGDVKAVYLDGAGSGAAVVDAFASLNVVDLKVQDDLTVTDDVIIGGDIDLEGSIDVNGTANLDIVDIDGAVNMATTALVTGVLTTTAATVFNGGFASNADSTMGTDKKIQFRDAAIHISSSTDGQLDLVADTEIQIAATTIDINGAINASGEIIAASLDISGDIDVDGTTNLDIVDIDGAVDMASTLGVGGRVTAAGVTTSAALISTSNSNNLGNTTISALIVDNFTLDGTTLALSSGDLTIDSAADIILDADGGDLIFKDDGTAIYKINTSSSNVSLEAQVSDADILFKGLDGSSEITALTLDISANGNATFIGTVNSGASNVVGIDGTPADVNAAELGPGYLNLSRDDVANRKMIEFGAGGSLLGSIFSGHSGTQVGIGVSTTGITFNPSTRSMMPADPTSANPQLDATLDIGFPSVRWKDLYLSGGAYIGGAVAANKFDDYEEGTWTPAFVNAGTTTLSIAAGNYTKVGDMVTAWFYVDVNSPNTSNALLLGGLPFTASSSNTLYGSVSTLHCNSWATTTKPDNGLINPGATRIEFVKISGQTGVVACTIADIGGGNLLGVAFYKAA